MSYVSISGGIKDILDDITDLKEVYAEEPQALLVYPCATISAVSHADNFADTARNQRTFTFMIRLYQRVNDVAHGESVLLGIADDVIGVIEDDPTLGGTCDFARPTRGNWTYVERETPVRVCEITVEALLQIAR